MKLIGLNIINNNDDDDEDEDVDVDDNRFGDDEEKRLNVKKIKIKKQFARRKP